MKYRSISFLTNTLALVDSRSGGTAVETVYHAPEIASRNALSPAIDVYGFGAIYTGSSLEKSTIARIGRMWPLEGVSELATEVIRGALNPSPGKCRLGCHVKRCANESGE